MKTAVIYARYSSERQTEQSIEGQIRDCTEYAERNDIVIVDMYIDRAMTGTNDKRNEFQRMLRDSAKRAWDFVLVYKTDRFGRNKYELAMNKHTLKTNGIRLIPVKENIPDGPEGIILESLLEGMAEYYSAELSQKVKRGMRETRNKGNFTGGYLPYGFKKDGKRVIVDVDKAEVVRFIYEQYAKNVYVKDIITALTDKGVLNNGKPFAKNTVHRILQNEKYVGIYRHGDEVFTNIYPPIVSEELFKIVQAKNDNNRYGSRSPFVNYLLRKKIICGYCGRTINGITGTSKSGVVKRYYSCSGRYLQKGCKKASVRKEPLESVVMQVIQKLFASSDCINSFADKIIAVNEKRLKEQSILSLLQQEHDRVIKAKNNMLAAIEQGIITAGTKERLQELEEKQAALSEKILIEKSKTKITFSKKDVLQYIGKALAATPERLIDILIKQIVLYDDKIIIRCNYAQKRNSNDEDLNIDICSGTEQMQVANTSSSIPLLHTMQVEVKA